MSSKSDILSDIYQMIIDFSKTDKEMGLVESETTSVCKDIFTLVDKIDSLE